MSLQEWKPYFSLADKISKTIIGGNISHAYIIEGDSCIDKERFAKDFVKAIVCKEAPGLGCDTCIDCQKIDHDNFEDLLWVRPDELSVKDEQIGKLQEGLMKKPNGMRNFAVIARADTMTAHAQNRLLKTLEEPIPGTVIVLLSENRENLMQTIKSRCIMYRLNDMNVVPGEGKIAFAEEMMSDIADHKGFFEMKTKVEKKIKSKDDAAEFLDGMERLMRQYLVEDVQGGRLYKKEELAKNIYLIEEARKELVYNGKYSYVVKNLLLKIGG